jgi:LacI family transcriptional regulator
MAARSATIKAVAEAAGVSMSSVSRVMNGHTSVDPSIAERVRAAAAALDYRPSPLARSLVLGQTSTVAVLVPDLENPTFQSILRGVSRAANSDGYRVLVADSFEHADDEPQLAIDLRRRCDALVLCAPRMPDPALQALLTTTSPVVVLNREAPDAAAPSLSIDYEAGVRQIGEHLAALGHRRIVYLEGNPQSASNRHRARGLRNFGAEHPDIQINTIPCGVSFEHGHAAADAVLASRATAVIAFNDLVATGLLAELGSRGVAVPDELSVAGFDDIPFAAYTTPALTTAAAPTADLGVLAWERVNDLLAGRSAGSDVNLVPRLRVRGSTAPPLPR